ncbi:MAG: DUF192 domain-containing protein [Ignavibacteria bacterium]|nr:DUF192 domain-containing protein [Ignavibacteria bacterium]
MAKKKEDKSKKEKDNLLKYLLIAVFILAAVYIIYSLATDKKETSVVTQQKKENVKEPPEPQFVKHGELEFFKRNGKTPLVKIDIEVADNDETRGKGMMYRKSNEPNRGMLFVFPVEEEQSFWMQNTYISLDIIFVNAQKEIVKIHKKATPRSTASLLSEKKAIYVVEVNGGFTDEFDIKEGDRIDFNYKK